MAAYAPPSGHGTRPRSVRGGNEPTWRAVGANVPAVRGGGATLHSRSPQDSGSDEGANFAQGTAVAAMRVASDAADADAAAGVSPLFVRRANGRPQTQTGPRAKTPGPASRAGRPAAVEPSQAGTQTRAQAPAPAEF